ncbi:piwi-like protein Siwi isoform X2 [Planococcus citri]|uniref:piwi-like protein Siwi isoform X2 n=1 Tax=Planococcus citri TaxID=170843 RepID=UPI0031F86B1B
MEGDQGAGRSRGRGRSKQKQQQPPPSVASSSSQPSSRPTAAPSTAPSTTASSGSTSTAPQAHGRGARGKPGTSTAAAAPPTTQMQGLQISGQRSGGNGSSNGGNGNGNGNGGDKAVGRYNIRGGRYIDGQTLHSRPESVRETKKGASGQGTKIQANLFRLTMNPNWTLNKYHVDFNPPEDRTRMRKIFLREHREKLGQYLFDGSTIFSSHILCPNNQSLELFSQRQSDNENIRITIKPVGTVEPGDYQRLQVFNIIVRECLSRMNLQLIKRNYFDKEAAVSVREHNLELWPGYITSMAQYEYDVLLQAEIVYKVLRKDTAYDLFRELTRSSGERGFRDAFCSTIIGCTVMTTYNDKTYKVDDVSFSETPESTFPQKTRDGIKHISYKDYFQQKYQARINDPRQPMLISKTSARDRRAGMPEMVYLVPELCIMTGLNDSMRSNYTLMRAVAEHTAVGPSDRVRRLENFKNRLTSIPEVSKKLKDWGLGISDKLVEVDGRILPQETIIAGQGKRFQSGPDVDWTKNLRTSPLLVSAPLNKWVVVFPAKLSQEAKDLARMIGDCGRGMNFNVPQPSPVSIPNDGASAYVQGIEQAVNQHHPELIVCVVPNNRSDRYSAIKKKTIVDKAVPSQVVLLKNIKAKSAMSIATKITIQINCKIGGAPWGVDIPIKEAMIVGFDVCHDSRDKSKSYGAMVATMDSTFGRYFSTLGYHASGDELSSSFPINMTKAVERYRKLNGKLPNPVILYRDGVGDGDLKTVYEVEIEAIQKQLNPLYEKEKSALRFAVIIVTKRINTRLFNNGRNPPPGTIVDDVVTNPHRFDFFLVSQSVRQGTVSPTHYNVLHDTTGLKVDHFQRLTYKMTHMYYNWSGTVRVPAPCQYAHKLAFLTSQSVGCAHSNLDQLLYFL